MPKKPAKNSYFYFMLDYKNREAKNGKILSLAQVGLEAGHEWAKMGVEERRPYEMRAREGKQETKVKKYTTTGQDIDLVLKQEKEEQDSVAAMEQAIQNIVVGSPYPPDLEFYVGYINFYCYCTTLNKYLPAEISIVRFSLTNGVDLDDIFHVILDTGTLPIGYRLVALKQSEDTHGIPIPPHDDSLMSDISEKNMRKVLQSMLDFLRKNSSSKTIPPVFFEPSNMSIAKDVLKNLIMDYGNDSIKEIKVYSLLNLFHQLRIAGRKDIFPITLAQAELDRDMYDYVQGISCEYHSVSDTYNYCSLSRSIRKIFIICDYTNPIYGIQLIAGKHVPKNASAERLLTYPVAEQNEAAALPPNPPPKKQEIENPWGPSLPEESASKKTKEKLRPPTSKSFAQTYRVPSTPQSANYKDDFPALGGGDDGPRPAAIGRGRGRILQNKTSPT